MVQKFVAATVPNGLCVDATAFAMGSDVFMHQSGGGANFETVSHEIGHIYGISPANTPTNKHRNSSVGVEGFQVRTKTNRSNIENSAFAISLMHTTVQTQGTQWIHNGDYYPRNVGWSVPTSRVRMSSKSIANKG